MSRAFVIIAPTLLGIAGGIGIGFGAAEIFDTSRANYAVERMQEMVRTSEGLSASSRKLLELDKERSKSVDVLIAADADLKRSSDELMRANSRLMLACRL